MFTIADIRNIAIQIELNGEKTYRKASEECTDPTMAKIFVKMAEDEKRHAKWFESIGIDVQKLTAQSLITPSCGTRSLSIDLAIKVLNLTRDISQEIRKRQNSLG